ncbi:MAG: SDR family oxidoreductase [Bacteroidia bacterium]|jgi:short-subunit dehydrogenase
MNSFQNKVVWITGASSGIGEALAKALAGEGAKLVLSSRRKDELERVQKSLKTAESNVFILPLDLADSSQTDELAQKVVAKFGQIDILINNGGISQRSLAKDTSLAIDRKVMEVNFFGTVALTKSVLPYMLKQQSGHIVVISSVVGKFGFYLRSAYSASKHALEGFFESLRIETHKDNLKVLIVCPGKIHTNISVNAVTGDGGAHNKMDESTEKGLSAEECARQILNGIKKNKEELLIGGAEVRAVYMKRFFPRLFSKLIRKQKAE